MLLHISKTAYPKITQWNISYCYGNSGEETLIYKQIITDRLSM